MSVKLQRRTYSVITNLCLILGVASAFGFDQTGHSGWFAIGGCAAVGAIATYLVQHWRAKSAAVSRSPALMPDYSSTIALWETPMLPVTQSDRVLIEWVQKELCWKTEKWQSADYVYRSKSHAIETADLVIKGNYVAKCAKPWMVLSPPPDQLEPHLTLNGGRLSLFLRHAGTIG